MIGSRKVKKCFVYSLLLLLPLTFFGCQTYGLKAYVEEDDEYSLNRGKEIVTEREGDIAVSIISEHEDSYHKHSIQIANSRNEMVSFNDQNIRMYQGDYRKKTWEPITVYTAEEYYSKIQRSNNITAVLLALSAIANSATAGQSTSYTSGSYSSYSGLGSGRFSVYTRTYDPAAAYLQQQAAQQQLMSFVSNSEAQLDNLENCLLYSSDIPPETTYCGIVYSKAEKGPDYKLTLEIDNSDFDFYYFRDDREEIVHPYGEKHRPQHAVYYANESERPWGIGYGYYSLKTGFNVFLEFSYPDYGEYGTPSYESIDVNGEVDGIGEYSLTGETLEQGYTLGVKINQKVSPHTWTSWGIGFDIDRTCHLAEHFYSTGTYWDTRWINGDPTLSLSPRIGVDLLWGHFLVSPELIWRGFSDIQFGASGGVVF